MQDTEKDGKPQQLSISLEGWERISKYEPEVEELNFEQPMDAFSPMTLPKEDYIQLPPEVNIYFVSKESDLSLDQPIHRLKSKSVLGIDCEWKPAITKYHHKGASLLQIGDKEDIFLIDLVSLSKSLTLFSILKQVLEDPDIEIIGMDFANDIKEITLRATKFKVTNYYDINKIYKHC